MSACSLRRNAGGDLGASRGRNPRVLGLHQQPLGLQQADLRVRVDLATWRELNAGTLSAPEALLRRRLHFHGNWLLAIKLHLILG